MLVCDLFLSIWPTVAMLREDSSFPGKGRIGNQEDSQKHQFQEYKHRLTWVWSNSFVTCQCDKPSTAPLSLVAQSQNLSDGRLSFKQPGRNAAPLFFVENESMHRNIHAHFPTLANGAIKKLCPMDNDRKDLCSTWAKYLKADDRLSSSLHLCHGDCEG